jgi:hypothetical protein
MSNQLKDGTGTGRLAQVNYSNKLMTLSVSESVAIHHTFLGLGYNINTGTINLTSANKSALLYLKNNGDSDIVINGFFYLLGNSDGTGDTLVQVERNPTGGTIVSGASDTAPINKDFGSANVLTADSFKGAEANTLTGGTVVIESLFASQGRKSLVGAAGVILRKGNSIGITVTPPASNTDMDVQIALSVYEAEALTTSGNKG